MTGPLRVALTVDVDDDLLDGVPVPGESLTWRGVDEGVPRLAEVLAEHDAPITWFLRVDDGVAGDGVGMTFVLEHFERRWAELRSAGHVLGLHPHLAFDGTDQTDELRRAHAAWTALLGAPVVSRLGGLHSTDALAHTLDELGVRVDATALPGRVRRDERRILDWSTTPSHPYRPSRADHRVPGEPSLSLVQVPFTVVPVHADYDDAPVARYVDLTFHPRALRDALPVMARADFLVTIAHPAGVVPQLSTAPHGLLSYDLDAVRTNMEAIVRACERADREVRFVTLDELAADAEPCDA